MAVLILKPHKLQYLIVEAGYEDANGDYHEGNSSWSEAIECDAVPASGSANEIQFEDGMVRKYSFTCYLNPNSRNFKIGERIRLYRNNFYHEYEVKGFQRYQLQCKLWV